MRKRVLLVEDNLELLGLLRLSFRAAGFAVATAADGVEALRKLNSVSPDLVILDLVLPELDGFAVCETLRRSPATSATRVICLTGLKSEFSRLAGMESGADEYLVKPIRPSDLIARARALLKRCDATATRQGVPAEDSRRRKVPRNRTDPSRN